MEEVQAIYERAYLMMCVDTRASVRGDEFYRAKSRDAFHILMGHMNASQELAGRSGPFGSVSAATSYLAWAAGWEDWSWGKTFSALGMAMLAIVNMRAGNRVVEVRGFLTELSAAEVSLTRLTEKELEVLPASLRDAYLCSDEAFAGRTLTLGELLVAYACAERLGVRWWKDSARLSAEDRIHRALCERIQDESTLRTLFDG